MSSKKLDWNVLEGLQHLKTTCMMTNRYDGTHLLQQEHWLIHKLAKNYFIFNNVHNAPKTSFLVKTMKKTDKQLKVKFLRLFEMRVFFQIPTCVQYQLLANPAGLQYPASTVMIWCWNSELWKCKFCLERQSRGNLKLWLIIWNHHYASSLLSTSVKFSKPLQPIVAKIRYNQIDQWKVES
jgi:sulfur relay (sulfurtransferase) DsrC/TusE family protein